MAINISKGFGGLWVAIDLSILIEFGSPRYMIVPLASTGRIYYEYTISRLIVHVAIDILWADPEDGQDGLVMWERNVGRRG